jgi:hypothetical protein
MVHAFHPRSSSTISGQEQSSKPETVAADRTYTGEVRCPVTFSTICILSPFFAASFSALDGLALEIPPSAAFLPSSGQTGSQTLQAQVRALHTGSEPDQERRHAIPT